MSLETVSGGIRRNVVERDLQPFEEPGIDDVILRSGERNEEDGGVFLVVHNSNGKTLPLAQQRMALPIYNYRTHLLYLIEKHPTTIIVGHTGCGKTTQIPQYLHEAGWTAGGYVVACTQPRRIAATSVAARVAEEMGCVLGKEVGYSIRFEDLTSPSETKIKYMTDGMLLRETMLDPLLSRYSVIMVDEAHERSIHTDVLLGLLKKIQRKRKDLRLVISSATLDAEIFKNYFDSNVITSTTTTASSSSFSSESSVISIEGRLFPIDVLYLKTPTSDYVERALETVLDIHKLQPPGDILVFLTGQEEILSLVGSLKERAAQLPPRYSKLSAVPLFAGLSMEKQQAVFTPSPKNTRKVIVSTNVAETSVTIDGIVYVVDCGFVKMRAYNPLTGVESLVIVPTSQSSARQRAGRAGRNRPGKCYRLYTEEAYRTQMPSSSIPELQRSNLTNVLLQLKALGIDDVVHFDFISPPPAESIVRSLELLYALGAIDADCKLTHPTGTTMAELPVDPLLGKVLLSSVEHRCSEEIVIILAMLQAQQQSSLFLQRDTRAADNARMRFAVNEGDHLMLLNLFRAYQRPPKGVSATSWCHSNLLNHKTLQQAQEIRTQLLKYMRRFRLEVVSINMKNGGGGVGTMKEEPTVAIRKSIVSGFFGNAAQKQEDGSYKTIREGRRLLIHPSSVLYKTQPEWVIFHQLLQTTSNQIYMHLLTALDNPLWLADSAPHYYHFQSLQLSQLQQR